jgi:hypothetical protein
LESNGDDSECESDQESDQESSDEDWDEDEPGFEQLIQTAFDKYDDIRSNKFDTLIDDENMSEDAARREVNNI